MRPYGLQGLPTLSGRRGWGEDEPVPRKQSNFNRRETLINVAPGGLWKYADGRAHGQIKLLRGQVVYCARCRTNLWVAGADSPVFVRYAWRVVHFPDQCYCKRCAQAMDSQPQPNP